MRQPSRLAGDIVVGERGAPGNLEERGRTVERAAGDEELGERLDHGPPRRNSMTSGNAVGSWMKKRWPPSYTCSSARRMRPTMASLLAGGAMPSYRPHPTNVGHVMAGRRSHTSWWRRASSCPAEPGPRSREAGDDGLVDGMARQPLGREPGVEDPQHGGGPVIGRDRLQLVERVRRAAVAARRGAEQRQPLDPVGPGDGELLGHHAAEAHADDAARVPAEVVEQGGGVGGVGRHRVRAGRGAGAAEAALVVGGDVEGLAQAVDHRRRRLQRGAGAVQEQQSGPVAAALVIEVDPVQGGGGHRRHTIDAP